MCWLMLLSFCLSVSCKSKSQQPPAPPPGFVVLYVKHAHKTLGTWFAVPAKFAPLSKQANEQFLNCSGCELESFGMRLDLKYDVAVPGIAQDQSDYRNLLSRFKKDGGTALEVNRYSGYSIVHKISSDEQRRGVGTVYGTAVLLRNGAMIRIYLRARYQGLESYNSSVSLMETVLPIMATFAAQNDHNE